jgi:ABC-type dipeptide/oligopeptide/nickel transport system ATPase subunit
VEDLKIYPGEAVYLKAGSGAGKTTVAKIIMGLQRADYVRMQMGRLLFKEDTTGHLWKRKIWAKRMTMVFQHADEALNLNGKVKDIFRGLPMAKRKNKAFLIEGGQKQRLNLIRALILNTDILILDEPFNGLDFLTLQKILSLLQERQKTGKSFLLISHNEEIIDRMVPPERIYYLKWERI